MASIDSIQEMVLTLSQRRAGHIQEAREVGMGSPRKAFGDGSGASGRSVANLLVVLRISLYVRLLRETIDCALELVGELPAFEIGEMACPSHAARRCMRAARGDLLGERTVSG